MPHFTTVKVGHAVERELSLIVRDVSVLSSRRSPSARAFVEYQKSNNDHLPLIIRIRNNGNRPPEQEVCFAFGVKCETVLLESVSIEVIFY